ncbi:MAG: RNA methyltransferase [Bacteroidia bacterium]|nr:RNA methyltransferase [Bacteroidia bacterium]
MHALSKAKLTHFAALTQKKYRRERGSFLVEGRKMVQEALQSGWPVEAVIVSPEAAGWITDSGGAEVLQAAPEQWRHLTDQPHPEGIMAVLRLPAEHTAEPQALASLPPGPGLLLEAVQDPGNLGAMLRIADWFGLQEVICSPGCAEVFGARALRGSMGAVFRVRVRYAADWDALVPAHQDRIWAADLGGTTLEAVRWQPGDWLLIGNEARGLSEALRALPGLRRVTIPRLGRTESLNAAVAAGILVWEMRGRQPADARNRENPAGTAEPGVANSG